MFKKCSFTLTVLVVSTHPQPWLSVALSIVLWDKDRCSTFKSWSFFAGGTVVWPQVLEALSDHMPTFKVFDQQYTHITWLPSIPTANFKITNYNYLYIVGCTACWPLYLLRWRQAAPCSLHLKWTLINLFFDTLITLYALLGCSWQLPKSTPSLDMHSLIISFHECLSETRGRGKWWHTPNESLNK